MSTQSSRATGETANWQERLAIIVDMMRQMSLQTDPQAMVRAYGGRISQLIPYDGSVSLSRRDLETPYYRITRASLWKEAVNPWKQKGRLPILQGGLLGELIYGDEPRIINDLVVADDDPAAEYLAGYRSLLAVPNFDQGVALNMVIILRREPGAFAPEQVPEIVWMSNLFGRATLNLVLSEEVKQAYELVDHELKMVADIQRSLLPAELPRIAGLELAASYRTSRRAGGDYYDFFPLPDGCWGVLIADVSGHGTPAAVLMAITHTIAHTYPGPPTPPSQMLGFVNEQLADRYTQQSDSFVTALYGIFDPRDRSFTYASAGHHPPRLKRAGAAAITPLDGATRLPLGISTDVTYDATRVELGAGDGVLFYTDGIIEADNPAGELFGLQRLDQAIVASDGDPAHVIAAVEGALAEFTAGQPPADDQTLLAARVV